MVLVAEVSPKRRPPRGGRDGRGRGPTRPPARRNLDASHKQGVAEPAPPGDLDGVVEGARAVVLGGGGSGEPSVQPTPRGGREGGRDGGAGEGRT